MPRRKPSDKHADLSLTLPPGLTMEEWQLIQDRRQRVDQATWFNRGLEKAILLCENRAKELGNARGEGYENLAGLLRLEMKAIVPKRGGL